jgi:hypothetical protein
MEGSVLRGRSQVITNLIIGGITATPNCQDGLWQFLRLDVEDINYVAANRYP